MSRSGVPSQFSDDSLELFHAIELEYDEETVRLCNYKYNVSIAGNTYSTLGRFLSISEVDENAQIQARNLTITVSGIEPNEAGDDDTFLERAMEENYQNRPARVYVCSITGGTVSAYQIFGGRMDTMNIIETGSGTLISLTLENRLKDLARPRIYRYTNEDQQNLYSGDTGLRFVQDLQDKAIAWGKS
jgi:hypothetical protein